MFFLWISFLLWANPINFQQDIKPGLIKEISYFTARKTQIDELLTGKRRIEEAIPSLIQVPLLQKEALSIQKSKLLQMLKLIEKERMSFDVPSELDSKTEAQWIALQRSVWTAHEEALELELKVILKLEIFNEQYSDFKDIQKYRKHLGEQLAQLSNVVLTDKELKNQTKELLNDQERLNRFVWELHHYALGQDSIRSTIEEDLSFNLDERSLIQIETSTLLLITAQALGSSSEIEDKLDSIAQMVLLREINAIQKQNDEESLILSFQSLSDEERETLIQKNEDDLKTLSEAKSTLLGEKSDLNLLKIQKLAAEEELLLKKNIVLKEGLRLEILKANLELQEALDKGEDKENDEFANAVLLFQEKRALLQIDTVKLLEENERHNLSFSKNQADLQEELSTILSLPPMDPQRSLRAQQLLNLLNTTILEQQTDVLSIASLDHSLSDEIWPLQLSESELEETDILMNQWKHDVSLYEKEIYETKRIHLVFLKDVKTIRRDLKADFGEFNTEESLFWKEFNNDILLVSLIFEQGLFFTQELALNIINVHFPELISLFRILLNVSLLISVWWLLLRQSDVIARFISSKQNRSLHSVQKIVNNLIYAGLPFSIMNLLIEEHPFISWIFRIYAFVFLFRCLHPILNALLVQDSDKQFNRLLFSLKLILIWWSTLSILEHLFIDIFQSDRLNDLLFFFGFVCFAFVLILVLHHWEEIITSYSKKEETKGFSHSVIHSKNATFIHKIIRSTVGLCVLLLSLLDYAFFVLVKGEGWVGSMLAERTIQELDTTLSPVSKEAKSNFRLQAKAHWRSFFNQVQNEAFVIFVGTLDDKKWESFNSSSRKKVFIKAPYLHKKEDLEEWLCSEFNVSSIQEWEHHLDELEESSFHIAEIERTLLRKVGGYDALEYLFQLPDFAKKHQFIYSVGPYCWGFLQSQMKPIFMGRMPCVIEDNGFPAADMTDFIKNECVRHGWSLSFFQLSRRSGSKETLKRVQEAYWRILWESSGGDLEVAKELFLSSVYQCEHDDYVEVLLFNKPKAEIMSSLSDKDKFLLTALLIHSVLSVEQISDLLYMSKQEVLKVCSDLKIKNMLQYENEEYFIPLRYRRTIAEYLKDQRLLC